MDEGAGAPGTQRKATLSSPTSQQGAWLASARTPNPHPTLTAANKNLRCWDCPRGFLTLEPRGQRSSQVGAVPGP